MSIIKRTAAVLIMLSILLVTSSETTSIDHTKEMNLADDDTTFNTWHHDCSNLTDFNGIGNDSWFYDSTTNVTGSMNSTDGYIYADDYGFGGYAHGPLRYHEIAHPFIMSEFDSIGAELEVATTYTDRLGAIQVMLYDDNSSEIASVVLKNTWNDYGMDLVQAFVRYRFVNGSAVNTPIESPTFTPQLPYHERILLVQNETGLFADIPRIGNFSLLNHAAVESSRIVKYVVIALQSVFSFSPVEVLRIHDIQLTYTTTMTTSETTSTSTTTSASDTPTTSPFPYPIDSLYIPLLLGLGVIVVLVIWRKSK